MLGDGEGSEFFFYRVQPDEMDLGWSISVKYIWTDFLLHSDSLSTWLIHGSFLGSRMNLFQKMMKFVVMSRSLILKHSLEMKLKFQIYFVSNSCFGSWSRRIKDLTTNVEACLSTEVFYEDSLLLWQAHVPSMD